MSPPTPLRPSRPQALFEIQLEVLGRPIWQSVQAGPGPIRLVDVLPLARRLCDRIASQLGRHSSSLDQPSPCRLSCCTCCRYLVPLTELESLDLLEQVEALPQPRRRQVLEAFDHAAGRIAQAGLPAGMEPGQLDVLWRWYRDLNLPCPLLADRQCLLYSHRPLACREHLVGPAADCARLARSQDGPLEMPLSVAAAVMELTRELTASPSQAVLLPLALDLARRIRPRFERTFPAARVFAAFARILRSLADASAPHVEAW